jgi:hypothetical protein
MPLDSTISKDFRKLFAFGSGVGLEIGATDLEVAITRVRPNKIQVLGRLTIENYASRPAAEWGAEYTRFLKAAGVERLVPRVAAAAPRKSSCGKLRCLAWRPRISKALSASNWTPYTPTARTCGVGLVAAAYGGAGAYCPAKHHRALMSPSLSKPVRIAVRSFRFPRRRYMPPSG